MFEKTYEFIPKNRQQGTAEALREFNENKEFLEKLHGFPIELVKCKDRLYTGTSVIYRRKKIPVYIGRIMQQS